MSHPPRPLIEYDDRWLLPFRGLTVISIQVDSALTLNLTNEAAVQIGGVATLGWVNAGVRPERVELDLGKPDVAAELVGTKVLSAVAFKSGGLRLVFDSGRVLRVKPGVSVTW